MNRSSFQTVSLSRVTDGSAETADDCVACEEPLAIELVAADPSGAAVTKTVAITMCTPGQPRELAAGFLLGEGIVRALDEVKAVFSEGPRDEEGRQHGVRVVLQPSVLVDWDRLQRHFYASSSCGVCGRTSLRALEMSGFDPAPAPARPFPVELLGALPERLRTGQELFDRTGGVHGAGIFDWDGRALTVQEDVGRHNAVDKAVGALFLRRRWPLRDHVLVVSGRASFELVQKAIAARIPLLVAVGAPSSLAIAAADEFGVCVAGFTKKRGFNIYTHAAHIGTGAEIKREVPA
jgi:FdhD protein